MALQLYNRIRHALRYWLLRRLPPCKQIAPLLSASMERRLTVRERVTVRLHLWVCVWCEWYLQHLHLLRTTLHQKTRNAEVEHSSVTAPDASTNALSDQARERIKLALASKER